MVIYFALDVAVVIERQDAVVNRVVSVRLFRREKDLDANIILPLALIPRKVSIREMVVCRGSLAEIT